MNERSASLQQWLRHLGYRDYDLSPASEYASFRSYLRLASRNETFVVMDAPPNEEPCEQFVKVVQKLCAAGLSAPRIITSNLEQGFLLLTDFGSSDYLSQLQLGTRMQALSAR